MSTIASVASVGAGLGAAQLQASYQVAVLKEQQSVTEDLGSAALRLIRTAMAYPPAVQHDLDIQA